MSGALRNEKPAVINRHNENQSGINRHDEKHKNY
jgi:hypothetical protein